MGLIVPENVPASNTAWVTQTNSDKRLELARKTCVLCKGTGLVLKQPPLALHKWGQERA